MECYFPQSSEVVQIRHGAVLLMLRFRHRFLSAVPQRRSPIICISTETVISSISFILQSSVSHFHLLTKERDQSGSAQSMRMPLDWLRTALWPISHLFAVAIIPLVLPQTLATPYDHGTTSTNYRAISVSSSQPFSCVFTLGHYSFNLCPLIAKGFSSRPTHVEDAGRSGVPAGMGASWTPSSLRSASAAVDSLTDIGQVESMLGMSYCQRQRSRFSFTFTALVLGGTTQIPRTLPSALTVSIKYDEGRLGDLHGALRSRESISSLIIQAR